MTGTHRLAVLFESTQSYKYAMLLKCAPGTQSHSGTHSCGGHCHSHPRKNDHARLLTSRRLLDQYYTERLRDHQFTKILRFNVDRPVAQDQNI